MKSTTKSFLLLSVTSLLMIGVNGSPSARAQSASSLPAWVSNPAYAKQLGPEVKVGNFSVSPPAGFHLEKTQHNSDKIPYTSYKWAGSKRADGSTPKFRIAIYKIPSSTPNTGTSKQWLLLGLSGLNSNGKRFIHSPITQGQIHGSDFARAYWKRDPKQTDKIILHGFQYVSSQGPVVITILSYDAAPHHKSTLDMMEAAALTLHQ